MSINNLIILVTVIISYFAMSDREKKNKLIHHPYSIKHNKEYYRLLSNGFIHGDWYHLAFNMITLYFFGGQTETLFKLVFGAAFGSTAFIIFYLSAIIFSCIPSQQKHHDNPGYGALGASGAVSAVLLISIVLNPTDLLLIMGVIPIPAWIFGIGYIWYSNRATRTQSQSNIGHDAHLYGSIYGCLVLAVIYPKAYPIMLEQIIAWLPF